MSQVTRYGFDRAAGQRHVPVPLVRRTTAYAGPWPIRTGRTMAEVMADEARCRAPRHRSTLDEITPGHSPGADGGGGPEGSAPEGTSGGPACGALHDPAEPQVNAPADNADQPHPSLARSRAKAGDETQVVATTAEACVEPVSRPGAGRSASATSEIMDATAGETAPQFASGAGDGFASVDPAPVSPPATVPCKVAGGEPVAGKRGLIDLAAAPSSMELRSAPAATAAPRVALVDDGKVFCRGCDARVPAWFGQGCIAGDCDLRGGGRAA